MFYSVKSLTLFFSLNPTYIRLTSKSCSLTSKLFLTLSPRYAGFGFAGN